MALAVPIPRRVMVGTDRSETAERAVRWAASFAERFGAELYMVQIVVPTHPPHTEQGIAERKRAAAIEDDLVRYAQAIAGNRGHGRIVVDQDPAAAIVRAAQEDGIDVLVVGNAGMAGRKEFLLGNVPNRISHNARCTVIIVNTLTIDDPNPSFSAFRSGNQEQPPPTRRIARGTNIAAVFAKHGLRELFGLPDEEGASGRRRQARRLRAALEELGPTFAKIGQLLSTRPDLLPPEFIEELSQLQDRVAKLTEEQVVQVMEQDLGIPWEDVFETIDSEPIAAGTIAQVHRASLATGERIVVKVQRPEAKDLIEQDLAILKLFAQKMGARPGLRQLVDASAVFEHLSASLRRELDFRLEAQSIERMRAIIGDFSRLAVPKVYEEFSTSRLLVMQDVGAISVSEIPAGGVRKETTRQFVESFCKQILIDGFFHADPHPGNLMWQPADERLYFLDLGLVGEVSSDLRELMMPLLMAFWQKDSDFLTDVLLMLSGAMNRTDLDVEGLRQQIRSLMAKYRDVSVKNLQFGVVLQEIIEISFRHGVRLPASLTLVAKSIAQMQLVAAQLDPETDLFDVAGRFLMRSLLLRLAAKSDAKSLFYQSQKFKVRALRVFETFEQLIGARPGDKLSVNFRALSLEDTVLRAGRRVALALTAGFAMLATALTINSGRAGSWVPAGCGTVGAAFMVILILDLWRDGKVARISRTRNEQAS